MYFNKSIMTYARQKMKYIRHSYLYLYGRARHVLKINLRLTTQEPKVIKQRLTCNATPMTRVTMATIRIQNSTWAVDSR
jgi:hypothetical protein